MILENLAVYGYAGQKHILTKSSRIAAIYDANVRLGIGNNEHRIYFDDAKAFPGFINSHDHLDFNLFPALASRQYNNYTEWGIDIHSNYKDQIEFVKRVPPNLRVTWGQYKNLLNGFTTVVEHGRKIKLDETLISVFQDCHCLHSPAFEKNWSWKLNSPFKSGIPVVMHIGEGIDDAAKKEIDLVVRKNYLRKKIVAVHGIAMNSEQARAFAALTWCPASNDFLIGSTARVGELKRSVEIVFGTDSALSSSWNTWDHFRIALKHTTITEDEMISMVTTRPARVWGLNDRGAITLDNAADILVTRKALTFFNTNPEDILLLMHRGAIKLYDESLASQLKNIVPRPFSRVWVNGSVKYVAGNLPELMKKIRDYAPGISFPIQAE
jgi:cytosine/adenosine deaminase-related metal-dependent hydrolase